MKFDVFLACAPKDFNKLPYVTKSIIDNVAGMESMYLCSPVDIPSEIQAQIPYAFNNYLDQNILHGLNRNDWRYRPNWHFQQYLKLFQKITNDWYLTWDCDTIACRPIAFEENGKPIYYYGWEQNHAPYFRFQNKMIGLGRVGPTTFVSDMNFIYRPIIEEMLSKNGYTIQSFIKKAQEITNPNCYMAECELYGSYVWQFHREKYVFKQLKQRPFMGREHRGAVDYMWKKDEIEKMIEESKDMDIDTFSIHSWFFERGIN